MKPFTTIFILGFIILSQSDAQDIHGGAQVGIGVPSGDFSEGWETGFGLTANALFQVETDVQVTGALSYHRFPKTEKLTIVGGSYSSVGILGGVRYTLSRSETAWYIGGEAGIHINTNTLEMKTTYETTVEESDSESAFGISLLGGLTYPLSDKLFLDANAKYHIVFTEVVNRSFLALNAGIIIPINL